ncbi:restriction endonuclease subunit S [bacterium]|nr:restriction endonuclease subunit S [bacterium]
MRLKENWRRSTLGELCSIEIGGTPSRSNVDFWDADKVTSNIWVSIKDLNTGCVTSTAEQISDLGVCNSNVKLQSEGTVLLSFKLSIGRVARAGKPLYTNEAIAGLRSEQLRHDFLYQGLQYWDLLKGVDQAIKGATLNKSKLRDIEIYYPIRKSEQSKIAEVLSTVDQAIEQTEALIAKQQRIKTGLMHDLLTRGIDEHGNLRSEETHEFKDSPLGQIPVEWDVKPVKDHITFITDYRGKTPPYAKDGIPVISAENVGSGVIKSTTKYVTRDTYQAWSTRGFPEPGDTVFTTEAPAGEVATIPEDQTYLLTRRVIALRPDETELRKKYLYWTMRQAQAAGYWNKLISGTTAPRLRKPEILDYTFPLPSPAEQDVICNVLESQWTSIKTLESQLIKLQSLKTGLMQDLLTGEVPVTPLLELAETA